MIVRNCHPTLPAKTSAVPCLRGFRGIEVVLLAHRSPQGIESKRVTTGSGNDFNRLMLEGVPMLKKISFFGCKTNIG